MQLINLIIASIILAVIMPIILAILVSYNFYMSSTLTKVAARRQADLLAVAAAGRKMTSK